MENKMEIWETIIRDMRASLPDTLRNMGGVSPSEEKRFHARWTIATGNTLEGMAGVNIEAEIAAALKQEMHYEIFNELLTHAQTASRFFHRFEKINACDSAEYTTKIFEAAEAIGPATIFASPTAITMLQACPSDLFVGNLDKSIYGPDSLAIVGHLKNHAVRCNPYWTDSSPVLITALEWFTYTSGDTLRATKTTDLQTQESVVSFGNDLDFKINPNKILRVEHDPAGISFY
jgi:hypothetical protein